MVRRLFRSRTQKVAAGVCGGLGEYFNIDPALVRVVFVILSFINGLGIIAYVAMWLVFPKAVPQEEHSEKEGIQSVSGSVEKEEPLFRPRPQRAFWLGLILIVPGLLWLLKNVNEFFVENFLQPLLQPTFLWEKVFSTVWPILLVAGGIIVLIMKPKK
ncbi:MAG: PspC domain-containing protein [Dehalococcoidia bacterium]|nr:PspC domain-containing protein [Dehalococcoidia bacterium]